MGELDDRLEALTGRVDGFAVAADVATKAARISALEESMASPGFWDDQERAQEVIRELKAAKGLVEPHAELAASLAACSELLELAEGDEETQAELGEEVVKLEADFEALEMRLALNGPYDASDIYLEIQPGAGGVEACDWAEMLYRMYNAYCARAGYALEVIDMLPGEEAGLKSCNLMVKGEMAYGYLKSEMGTHRLVRMSPFNAQGKRQTSFASVQIVPVLPDAEMPEIEEKDLRVDTYRASGAGGQHVNVTDSAVRITHVPTGLVAAFQNERSQIQNRATAMKMLAAKIAQLEEANRLKELQDLQGERGTIGWGHQIRSYVLQPTQLVTDLRTRHKEGNADGVLDGDLQPFIDSYLRWRLGNELKES